MPRRTLTPATPAPAQLPTALPKDIAQLAESDPVWAANLQQLRCQWKWAAVSQFFYTFAPLLAMPDVSLIDIEDDLARGTALYLPRLMQRLLIALTQDRKITVDNWQTALRKQYMRRDPAANPIGPEPKQPSRESSREPSVPAESSVKEGTVDTAADTAPMESSIDVDHENATKEESLDSHLHDGVGSRKLKDNSLDEVQSVKREDTVDRHPAEDEEESKDWLDLPMLAKLDSLHLLTEWQFQNPHRLRTLMKDDDEGAHWRIEPIGYDAKTNAYWLIGPDRIWIQRVPPKPPKGVKRKRPTGKRPAPQASTGKVDQGEYESDSLQSPKRKRVQPQTSNRRASRSQNKPSSVALVEHADGPSSGRGTRAAKLQANKKLDVQAKELAEFQRQAAALAASSKSSRAHKQRSQAHVTPTKTPNRLAFGTRASARLRGAASKEDDEWQQIPDEWLQETLLTDTSPNASKKGKVKAKETQEESADMEQDVTTAADGLKTGLESDDTSELTELSDVDESGGEKNAPGEPPVQSKSRPTRSRRRAAVTEQTTSQNEPRHATDHVEDADADETLKIPEGFIEWEAICVTLYEWEHIAERFEKATHYLEKALYKMLTQHIAPAVITELRELERRHKLEEAVVHRKRSSRIAIKESEKEETRLASRKKAEEEEKMARAKRLEVRAKKEEIEREKRERAREQRRLEREEREQRAREKEERAERKAKAEEDRSSRATPALNGTHSAEPIQLSSVTTPTGVQTPNWILDCEICGKHGVNLDDGLPMVSCGMCSKWQHITCHDLADQRAGRPRRNWDVQQFCCRSCRARHSAGMSYGTPGHQRYASAQQYPSWSQSPVDSAQHLQKPVPSIPRDLYSQSTSDVRFLPRQQSTPNGIDLSREPYSRNPTPSQSGYPRTQNGITFSHYQPEQRAFSSIRSSQPPHAPAHTAAWGNGYPMDSLNRASQSVPFTSQYPQGSGSYASGRMPAAYQQPTPPIPQHHPYGIAQEPATQLATTQWGGGSNGYPSSSDSAVRSAAESLAYLQAAANGHQNGWNHPVHSPPPQGNGDMSLGRGYPVTAHTGHNPMGGAPPYQYPS